MPAFAASESIFSACFRFVQRMNQACTAHDGRQLARLDIADKMPTLLRKRLELSKELRRPVFAEIVHADRNGFLYRIEVHRLGNGDDANAFAVAAARIARLGDLVFNELISLSQRHTQSQSFFPLPHRTANAACLPHRPPLARYEK